MKNNKVLEAGIGYIIGNYLLKGLSFITLPIFSRLLSKSDFGIYNVFLSYEGILFILIGLAIHSSYKNAKFKDCNTGIYNRFNYRTYISTTYIMICFNALVFLIIVNIFHEFWMNLLGIDWIVLNCLILYSFANAIITCFNNDCSLNYKYKRYLKVSSANAILSISLSLLLIFTVLNKSRFLARIIGTSLPIFIISVVILMKTIRQFSPSNYKLYLSWGIKFSLPIVAHGISQVILNQFDRIMIRNIISDEAAGIYSFAYTIYSILLVTVTSLDSVWMTWFYENMNGGAYCRIRKYSNYYMLGILILSIMLMLLSPELILILGSTAYSESVYCVIPIIVGGFFSFMYCFPASIEYYYEKTQFIALGTCVCAFINIILNFICIEKFGYISAAYTTAVSYIIYFMFHYFIAFKIAGRFIYSNKSIAWIGMSLICSSIICLLLVEHMFIRWIMVLIILIITILVEEKQFGFIGRILKNKNL